MYFADPPIRCHRCMQPPAQCFQTGSRFSDEAYAEGCKCPILDNQDMPDHKKWVNGDCPLHGTGK